MSPVSLMMLIVVGTVCVCMVVITIGITIAAVRGGTKPENDNQVFNGSNEESNA